MMFPLKKTTRIPTMNTFFDFFWNNISKSKSLKTKRHVAVILIAYLCILCIPLANSTILETLSSPVNEVSVSVFVCPIGGNNTENCGAIENPCHGLEYGHEQSMKQLSESGSNIQVLHLCSNVTHFLAKEVRFSNELIHIRRWGNGTAPVVDLRNNNRAFYLDSTTLHLYGIHFKNGYTGGAGAVISGAASSNASLTIDSCEFSSSRSMKNGGAIALNNIRNIHLENSKFVQNRAAGTGGAVSLSGISAHAIANPITIFNCYFGGNYLNSELVALWYIKNFYAGHGGALYLSSISPVLISGCHFEGNTVRRMRAVSTTHDPIGGDISGGAISIENVDIGFTLISSQFHNNSLYNMPSSLEKNFALTLSGGAVSLLTACNCIIEKVIVRNCSFLENYAFESRLFVGYSLRVHGGAFSFRTAICTKTLTGTSFDLSHTEFSRNAIRMKSQKNWGYGGGLFIGITPTDSADNNLIIMEGMKLSENFVSVFSRTSNIVYLNGAGAHVEIVARNSVVNNSVGLIDSVAELNRIDSEAKSYIVASGAAISVQMKGSIVAQNSFSGLMVGVSTNTMNCQSSVLSAAFMACHTAGINVQFSGSGNVFSNSLKCSHCRVRRNAVMISFCGQDSSHGSGLMFTISSVEDDGGNVFNNTINLETSQFIKNSITALQGECTTGSYEVLGGAGAMIGFRPSGSEASNISSNILVVSKALFESNYITTSSLSSRSTSYGSGLFLIISTGNFFTLNLVSIVDSVFRANRFRQSGTVNMESRCFGAGLNILFERFESISSNRILCKNCTFSANNVLSQATVTLTGSIGVIAGSGMSIVVFSPRIVQDLRVDIEDSEFVENSVRVERENVMGYSSVMGGGLSVDIQEGKSMDRLSNLIRLFNTSFIRNQLLSITGNVIGAAQGGAIGITGEVKETNMTRSNQTTSINIEKCTFSGNKVDSQSDISSVANAGAIFIGQDGLSVELTASKCVFKGNQVRSNCRKQAPAAGGGGVSIEITGNEKSQISFSDSDFVDNRAEAGQATEGIALGGALHYAPTSTKFSRFECNGCRFEANTASSAAAFFVRMTSEFDYSHNVISNSKFLANYAEKGSGGAGYLDAIGAVQSGNSSRKPLFEFSNCIFAGNQAKFLAGDLMIVSVEVNLFYDVFFSSAATAAKVMHLESESVVVLRDSEVQFAVDSRDIEIQGKSRIEIGRNVTFDCPPGAPAALSTNIMTCRTCSHNFFSLSSNPSAKCMPCPSEKDGVTCLGGKEIRVLPGFQAYFVNQSTIEPLMCPSGFCCVSDVECNLEHSCAKGRDQSVPFCGSCKHGYSEVFGSTQCREYGQCGSGIDWFLAFLFLFLLFCYVLLQLTVRPEPTFGVMKSVLYFVQVAELFLPASGSGGSLSVVAFFLRVGSFDSDAIGVMSPGGACPFPIDSTVKILSGYVNVAILFMILFIIYILTPSRWKRKPKSSSFHNDLSIGLIPLDQESSVDRKIYNDLNTGSRFNTACISLVLAAYTTLTKTTFSALDCRPVPNSNGNSDIVLFHSGQFQCFGQWFQILAFFLIPLLLLIPYSIGRLARIASRKEKTTANLLTVCYKKSYWYWESVMMLRRTLIITIVVFVSDEVWRAFIFALICLLVLAMNVVIEPFESRIAQRVESVLLSLLLVLSIINVRNTTLMSVGKTWSNLAFSVLQSAIQVVPMIIVVIYYGKRFGKHFARKKESSF